MGEIVTDLVERYEEERFWTRVRGQLAALKADPVAWQDYLDELALFDQMAGDGLEHEDPYEELAEEEEIQQHAAHAQDR